MARIRTIKPEFFRHEGLQDLEADNPGAYCMLVFAGLWGNCDKAGRFEWKPRTLKLDILPFLDFDMSETLSILQDAGFIQQHEVNGKQYGFISTFSDHQRITGKEAQEPPKYPSPVGNNKGSNGETVENQSRSQEGKGKGKEREEEGNGSAGEQQPPRKKSQQNKTSLPEDFDISERVKKWAKEKGHAQLAEHLESFRSKCKAKGYKYVDWDEAFMGAIRDNWARLTVSSTGPPGQSKFWGSWWTGIVERGKELGLTQGEDEPPPRFKERVYEAAKAAGEQICWKENKIRPYVPDD